RFVRGSFSFPLTRANDVRLVPALGGGSLWDVGIYPVSYARLVLGAEPVEAAGWQTLGPRGGRVPFAAQLRFPSGVVMQCDAGFRAALRHDMEIVGSEASLLVPNPFKPGPSESVTLLRGDEREAITVAGPEAHLYVGEVEDLCDAVRL